MSNRVQELFESKMRKVASAYEKGTPMKDIAERVGVSPPTIDKWLTKEGYRHKKRGRYPIAMKARARDLQNRGWSEERIASLMDVSEGQIQEWLQLKENPVLGGEKDPLKIRGGRKAKGKKKPRKSKKALLAAPKGGWPPPRHKCRKHWSPVEENYVLQMMQRKISILDIYKRMRASRQRQLRIWRKYGGKGLPPNFPPPKEPPKPPTKPPAPGEAAKRKALIADIQKASTKELEAMEEATDRRRKRIAELEAAAIQEEQQIKAIEQKRKTIAKQLKADEKQLKAIEAAAAKRPALPGAPRKVLPGSYEAEQLGMPVGSVIRPRKAMPAPEGMGKYADNGRYFVVSKDWADLEDASPDELALFAYFLTQNKLPAVVEPHGNQPTGYFEGAWPKRLEERWAKTVNNGLKLLDRYRKRKTQLAKQKAGSKDIALYLATAYDAYRNAELNEQEKQKARKKLTSVWKRIGAIDRSIMIFSMKVADLEGAPTSKGIERGHSAKVLLGRASGAAVRQLKERKAEAKERAKIAKDVEDDEVAAMLAGAKSRFALPEGEEE